MKTEPISVTPSESLDSRLDALCERTGLPKDRLMESLADEAERTRRYPGLGFRDAGDRRRPWLIGSPFDVWEAIELWQDFHGDADAIVENFALTRQQLELAVAYYREFPEQIDQALKLQRQSLEELALAYPFIQTIRVNM